MGAARGTYVREQGVHMGIFGEEICRRGATWETKV